MVSGVRTAGNIGYNPEIKTDDKPAAAPAAKAAPKAAAKPAGDAYETAPAGETKTVATPDDKALPDKAAKPKKKSAIASLWDKGMKELLPLTKTEIKTDFENTFKLDEAEKYKLDLKGDVDLEVLDKGLTANQKAFMEAHEGSMLITSKINLELKASATTPVDYIKSGEIIGGIGIDVQMPMAIDPKKTPTKQVLLTTWDRIKSTTLDLPYTAKGAKELPLGAAVTASFTLAGGIALSAEDQSAEIDRRTKVTVTMERGKDGQVQLTIIKQRIDKHALDLKTGELLENIAGTYKRDSSLDRTTVEVFNVNLDDDKQLAAMQKALPWTGGKHKLIPGISTKELKNLGCADEAKASDIKKRKFSDKLDISAEYGTNAGGLQISRTYDDGKYTISSLLNLKTANGESSLKELAATRSNVLVLPDKEAKLSPKQASAQAFNLSRLKPEAWRTAPEGTKLTSLVSASLALTYGGDAGLTTTGSSAWQLDPSGSQAITVEVTQTADGPKVKIIQQDKLALLAQIKATNISSDNISTEVKEFGLYEAIEDYLQDDCKALKAKYPGKFDEIKAELDTIIGEQLAYNIRLSAGRELEGLHEITFGPFALADTKQKDAFNRLTGDLNLAPALELGLMEEVTGGLKKGRTHSLDIDNHESHIARSKDTKRTVKVDRDGDKLTITVTDTTIKELSAGARSNDVVGEYLDNSDLAVKGGTTGRVTKVNIYKMDLSKEAHRLAWEKAIANRYGDSSDFELDFSAIDALGVRDPDAETITKNRVITGQIDVNLAEGPLGLDLQLAHEFKDDVHTVSGLRKLTGTLGGEEGDKDKLTAGHSVSTKVKLPDPGAELKNTRVVTLSNELANLELEAWKAAPKGTTTDITHGISLANNHKDSAEKVTEKSTKAALWTIDPSGNYLSTVHIEQTDKGPIVTLIQERKEDIAASFKHTRASDLKVSEDIASFGIYDAVADYLQNDGKALKKKFGDKKYAELSKELKEIVDEKSLKNRAISASTGRNKAVSTSFGPFDLSDPKQAKLFLAAGQGNMKPALDAGYLAGVTSKKVHTVGGSGAYNAVSGSVKGSWDNEHKLEFKHNDNGTISLTVTKTRLTDNASGVKFPDVIETVDINFNADFKNSTTTIYVYELDPSKPEHQKALDKCLAQINDNSAPEKALEAIAALNVRNPEKEKLIKKNESNVQMGVDATESPLGAAFNLGREHKDGKYNFSSLFSLNKDFPLAQLDIGNIGALSAGMNVLGTRKVDISIPDGDGALPIGDATALSLRLAITDDSVWKELPVGTTMTHIGTGAVSIKGEANVGKDVKLMDGLTASLKAGFTINPSKNKVLGTTVTITANGPEVVFWQEDIASIAMGLEASVGISAEIKEFGVYNAITDWLEGGSKLTKKYGKKGCDAACKSLEKLVKEYLNASFSAKAGVAKEHKEKATFGPFNMDNPDHLAAFNSLVRFYKPEAAMKANLLKAKQVDNSVITIKKGDLKLSVLELLSQSELKETNSDFEIRLDTGELLTCTSYGKDYTKKGKDAIFKGESFTFNWEAFAVHKTSGDKNELVDVFFQGSFDMKDRATKKNEAADWRNFCKSLNLTITRDENGKSKVISGYGKGEGKIQYGCSLSSFTEMLKHWQPMKNREIFLMTTAAFEDMTIPPGEQNRSAIGAMPLDTQALKLAKKYDSAFLKSTKEKIEKEFKHLYPDSKVSIGTLTKGYKLLAKYWETRSEKDRKAILKEYNKISPSSGSDDCMIFLASYSILKYENSDDDAFKRMHARNYAAVTDGRDIAEDIGLISDANNFMREMDKIQAKWAKKGGNDSAEAMKELVNGVSKFGRKHSPTAVVLSRMHEHEMFINMATFLNLIGENNNAVDVYYKAERFKLEAKGQASVTKKSAAGIVDETKKAIEAKNK